jgi:hypothetical protein
MAKEDSSEKEVNAIIRVEGGTADDGMLEIYDAATMIHGIARAVNIVAHAFSKDEEIRVKAHNAHGVKTLLHSSKKGCFEEQIDIIFSHKLAAKIGHSVISSHFWDYLNYCWSMAVGVDYAPTSSHLRNILEKDEDFGYIVGDALESAMLELHKPIARDSKVRIFVARPRVGDMLTLTKDTLAFVNTRTENTERLTFSGNVTRFNVLSDFGRLFSNSEKRVVSFKLAEAESNKMQKLVIQSMKDRVEGKGGRLIFQASQVLSSQGLVKRYVVHNIETADAE